MFHKNVIFVVFYLLFSIQLILFATMLIPLLSTLVILHTHCFLVVGLWWEQYGDSAPGLQRVAIRILSQVCSTFSFHRQWSNFRQIHSEKRNKIDRETLNDLVYINYNLKLARQMNAKSSEVDLLQLDDMDMTSEWVEENETASPTQWLDRFGPALDGNDLNTRQFSSSIFGANDPIFGL